MKTCLQGRAALEHSEGEAVFCQVQDLKCFMSGESKSRVLRVEASDCVKQPVTALSWSEQTPAQL